MSGSGKTSNKVAETALEKDWRVVSGFLRDNPDMIRQDDELLADLGLRLRTENIVDFGPVALSRLAQAKVREESARIELEQTARSNFAAQAQSHAAVIDLLEARNHSDLARRLEEIAQLRFGLVTGIIAIETDGPVPAGWRGLVPGMTDKLLGPSGLAQMGQTPYAELLFSQQAEVVHSTAMVRIALGNPVCQGVLAFGSSDPKAFSPEMGAELVAFIARVCERTAERWPIA
jgi:uncharacterized protein YigA (DUF484 family)